MEEICFSNVIPPTNGASLGSYFNYLPTRFAHFALSPHFMQRTIFRLRTIWFYLNQTSFIPENEVVHPPACSTPAWPTTATTGTWSEPLTKWTTGDQTWHLDEGRRGMLDARWTPDARWMLDKKMNFLSSFWEIWSNEIVTQEDSNLIRKKFH